MFQSRARTLGRHPIIIRYRNDPNIDWIERKEFEALPLLMKKDYALIYCGWDANKLKNDEIDYMFCEHNTRLPILPIHQRRSGKCPDGVILRPRETGYYCTELDRLLDQPRSANHDFPWLPNDPKNSLIPERLVPVDDIYEDHGNDSIDSVEPPAPIAPEPTRVELKIVYPPEPAVIGKDPTSGKDILQPLPEDWLWVMLEEQEVRSQALKAAYEKAYTAVAEAAAEVASIEGLVKREADEFNGFIKVVDRISGKVSDRLQKVAQLGETHGHFENVEDDLEATGGPKEPRNDSKDRIANKRARDVNDDRDHDDYTDNRPPKRQCLDPGPSNLLGTQQNTEPWTLKFSKPYDDRFVVKRGFITLKEEYHGSLNTEAEQNANSSTSLTLS